MNKQPIKVLDGKIFCQFHAESMNYQMFPGGRGGVLALNLYRDVPKKMFFYMAPEFLPSNDTRFWKESVKTIF